MFHGVLLMPPPPFPQLINTNNDKKISLAEWEAFMSSTELPPPGAMGGPPVSPTPAKAAKPIPEEVAMF
jgi:hypothetical protein